MGRRCTSVPDEANKEANGNGKNNRLFTFGLGGVVACCGAIEVLGGAVALGGIATALGLSTGLTYLTLVGLAGSLSALLALVYHQRTRRT